MVLVDTNVWINHFHKTEPTLVALLNTGSVVCHPFIVGELAAGNFKNRVEILSLFMALPSILVVESEEYFEFVETRKLMGKGLSFVDIHILASAVLARTPLWTEDKRLSSVAKILRVEFKR